MPDSPVAVEVFENIERSEEAFLEAFGKSDPLEDNGDYDQEIAFINLDPAPWNPKKPIQNKYKRGLAASITTFKISDTLKVWPNPNQIGRFTVLDGNQRFVVIQEEIEDYLISRESAKQVLGELPHPSDGPITKPDIIKRMKAAYQVIFADESLMSSIRSKVGSTTIMCRVKPTLDREGAVVFTSSFNRNHAVYDEAKLVDLVASLTSTPSDLIKRLIRPEMAFNNPAPAPLPITTPTFNAPAPPPVEIVPTEDEPWGPPPVVPELSMVEAAGFAVNSAPPPAPLAVVSFCITQAGHAQLMQGILKSKSRVIREPRLISAVGELAAIDDSLDVDDIIVELALRIVNDRMSLFKNQED